MKTDKPFSNLSISPGCIAWYFYNVFSTAVYTRVTTENPSSMSWPTTVVCERQAFRRSKIAPVPNFNTREASLLTWSLGPQLANPEVGNF